MYEKASKDGVKFAFTLDYSQICKRRGHVFAGIKIVDKDTRHPSSKVLLFQNGNGAQANEELVCIPLHFVNAKESHELFKTDLEPFMFAKQYEKSGIKGTKPLINCSFPMDMSVKPKKQ